MKLIHGDAIEGMKSIPDNSIDLCLTDPPYGTTDCKWDIVIPFQPMWEQLKRIMKDKGAICLFGTEPFSSHLRLSNLKHFKYDWIWNKVTARGHLVAKYRPMQQTEIISVFCNKNPHNYYPQMVNRPKDKIQFSRERKRSSLVRGERKNKTVDKKYDTWYPKNIITISNATSGMLSVHPTQKPVGLMKYLIKTYTNKWDVVLDFTMGSGTTGLACKKLNRDFIGIELDKEYFEIAEKRITECSVWSLQKKS